MSRSSPETETLPSSAEPIGELVQFFRGEGYSRFGWDGDSRGWSPERTAIEAMRTFMQREQAAFDLGFRAAGGSCPLPPSVEALFQSWQRGHAQTPAVLEALTLAEDVLSRRPFSSGIWPNGMHPQEGIEKIRAALAMAQALEVTDEMLERATAAFYEQQEGPINFTAGMRAAITAALSVSSTDREGK